MKENPISFQLKLKPEDFLPATEEEKQSQVIMRESVSFWKDGARRLRKNKVAMVSLVVIILVMIFSFIVPSFYPYNYNCIGHCHLMLDNHLNTSVQGSLRPRIIILFRIIGLRPYYCICRLMHFYSHLLLRIEFLR